MSQAVLFDFDGVIADSAELGFEVTEKLYPGLSREVWKSIFEGNGVTSIRDHGGITLEEQWHHYKTHYDPALQEVAMYLGMEELLPKLAASYMLFIISSAHTAAITAYLQKHGLEIYFKQVLGGDVHVSKHEKIISIFREFDLNAGDCVFVTDTLGDIRESTAAGVASIAVLWGIHDRTSLQKGNPWALAATPEELSNLIEKRFRG